MSTGGGFKMLKVGKDNLKATEVDVEALLNQLEKHRLSLRTLFMSLGLPDEWVISILT